MQVITEQSILEELYKLPAGQWAEVLKFISFLQYSTKPAPVLTARELLASPLVGAWAERSDIGDNLEYARQLRQDAKNNRTDNCGAIHFTGYKVISR